MDRSFIIPPERRLKSVTFPLKLTIYQFTHSCLFAFMCGLCSWPASYWSLLPILYWCLIQTIFWMNDRQCFSLHPALLRRVMPAGPRSSLFLCSSILCCNSFIRLCIQCKAKYTKVSRVSRDTYSLSVFVCVHYDLITNSNCCLAYSKSEVINHSCESGCIAVDFKHV